MKVGFTGTQRGMTEKQKERFRNKLINLDASEFHHGDCIGADEQADAIARSLGIPVEIHPPINESKRANCELRGPTTVHPAKDYIPRNHDIVDFCEVMVATPREIKEQIRSGTWATVRYARKVGRIGFILTP